jgi:hypothetical protein
MNGSTIMARGALLAALVLVAIPGQAPAQSFGPFPPVQEEYGPGITVSGIGLSRVTMPTRVTEESAQQAVDAARPRSAARGMADARRRAAAIAEAAGVSLGQIKAVELDSQFADDPPCRRSRRTRELRCRIPAFVGVSAEVTFEIAGGPTSSEDARELTATGVGSAPVDSPRETSPSIRHSLFAARLAATPNAAAAARRNVELAANAAGLALGPLFSIVEPANPYGYQPLLGVFGPGRFCGVIRRAIVRRDPDTGIPRVVGRRRVRRCFNPRTTQVRLKATYLAQGG